MLPHLLHKEHALATVCYLVVRFNKFRYNKHNNVGKLPFNQHQHFKSIPQTFNINSLFFYISMHIDASRFKLTMICLSLNILSELFTNQ